MSLTQAREMAVLSVVMAHPVHGYQIATAFEKGPLQLLGLQRATVYAILTRFVKRGWVIEQEEAGGAYPDRRVNHVTDAGRAALAELMPASGELCQTPLMALMMLHDSGVDVTKSAQVQLSYRRAFMTELLEEDSHHTSSISHQLAVASVDAEIRVLETLVKTG